MQILVPAAAWPFCLFYRFDSKGREEQFFLFPNTFSQAEFSISNTFLGKTRVGGWIQTHEGRDL